jgi:HAD superfamily hydrolase (TIGR01450 family)
MPNYFSASPAPARHFDVALLDLDGVVYVGDEAVLHAVETLGEARSLGMKLAYVTNNASRPPSVVAEHLRELGIPAHNEDVVTSAQAGARVLAGLLPAGSPVLAIGGAGVDAALTERDLVPVRSRAQDPIAVMQGFGKETSWSHLADAALVLASGVPWVATNMDLTIPTPDGRAPGNGAFVNVLVSVTGRVPDAIAGKPERPLMDESILRTDAQRPVMVGDRLDTDIEAATRAGIPSLLVLTGVTHAEDLLAAPPPWRPDLLSADLRGLMQVHPEVLVSAEVAVCRSARARVDRGGLVLEGPSETLADVEDLWRVAAVLAWSYSVGVEAAVARMRTSLRALL